ncbi:MAG: hypothetical protein BWY21_01507 [Parcubacteria group bacterium ADurb.Bin216]|nr:MAG: hypothetical protein BWY21_01507 [Parcubacteria group bacterium ADurb.Bin216]
MKKLLYLFLLPSILFSQTTPSVTPRADGEGSIGTETYRWGEGHFGELYVEAPSLADDSNRVPTTSWVNNLIQSDGSLVDYIYKNTSFTAEPNKKYSVDTSSGNITITLPELSEELIASSIVVRHSTGTGNIIINRAGSNTIVEAGSHLTSFTFKGLGSQVDLAAYTSSVWLIIRSSRTIEPSLDSDTNVAATTAWVNDLVEGNVSNITTLLSGYLKKNSYPTGYQTHEGELILDSDWEEKILTLDMPDYGNLNAMWALDYDGIIDVMAQDYDPYTSKLLLSFKDIFTSSPYTEFVQPVKAPTPAAADDSTNVATTAWVQDEIALKQNKSNAMTTNTAQEVTAVKTFRVPFINQAPTSSNFNVFSIGSVSSEDWYLQYQPSSKNLRWLARKGGQYPSPMQFLWNSNGKVIADFSESPTVPTPTAGDNSTLAANTEFVQSKAAGALLTEETPASSSATGTKGMIRYDSTYIYVCVETDTWIRFKKATW